MFSGFEIMRSSIRIWAVMFVASVCLLPMWGQREGDNRRVQPDPGEQQAEREVSLSADKIVDILKREPGLLLEVKKMLVKEAYDQGRILASEDLTDEAVFTLVRGDAN